MLNKAHSSTTQYLLSTERVNCMFAEGNLFARKEHITVAFNIKEHHRHNRKELSGNRVRLHLNEVYTFLKLK